MDPRFEKIRKNRSWLNYSNLKFRRILSYKDVLNNSTDAENYSPLPATHVGSITFRGGSSNEIIYSVVSGRNFPYRVKNIRLLDLRCMKHYDLIENANNSDYYHSSLVGVSEDSVAHSNVIYSYPLDYLEFMPLFTVSNANRCNPLNRSIYTYLASVDSMNFGMYDLRKSPSPIYTYHNTSGWLLSSALMDANEKRSKSVNTPPSFILFASGFDSKLHYWNVSTTSGSLIKSISKPLLNCTAINRLQYIPQMNKLLISFMAGLHLVPSNIVEFTKSPAAKWLHTKITGYRLKDSLSDFPLFDEDISEDEERRTIPNVEIGSDLSEFFENMMLMPHIILSQPVQVKVISSDVDPTGQTNVVALLLMICKEYTLRIYNLDSLDSQPIVYKMENNMKIHTRSRIRFTMDGRYVMCPVSGSTIGFFTTKANRNIIIDATSPNWNKDECVQNELILADSLNISPSDEYFPGSVCMESSNDQTVLAASNAEACLSLFLPEMQ